MLENAITLSLAHFNEEEALLAIHSKKFYGEQLLNYRDRLKGGP